jgi:hypothetical protein
MLRIRQQSSGTPEIRMWMVEMNTHRKYTERPKQQQRQQRQLRPAAVAAAAAAAPVGTKRKADEQLQSAGVKGGVVDLIGDDED